MRVKKIVTIRLIAGFFACAIPVAAQPTRVPRYPQGVYVDIGHDQTDQISTMVANPEQLQVRVVAAFARIPSRSDRK